MSEYKLHLGSCLDHLEFMPDNSVDSIVTDPPYGLSFMGKKWDYDVPAVEIWAECFGKDPSTIKRSDTYDIFGMLMKIGGWEKYSGNRNGLLRRPPYGPQRCYVRK